MHIQEHSSEGEGDRRAFKPQFLLLHTIEDTAFLTRWVGTTLNETVSLGGHWTNSGGTLFTGKIN